jgi:hypothetical protein
VLLFAGARFARHGGPNSRPWFSGAVHYA